MSDPFVAEIRFFAGNFAPRGWALCNGQLLPIAQNTALFSLVGTTYGGDGRTTFGLPDLRGRAPMHPGNGPGLTSRQWGETGGVETVTLTEAQMSNHIHHMRANLDPGEIPGPGTSNTLARSMGASVYATAANLVPFAPETLPSVGGGQPHTNIQPYLAVNFIIALVGTYPSRS